MTTNKGQDEVLDFWFRELTPDDWFKGSEALDLTVRERFGALYAQAREGSLATWAETPLGRLALILVLDQFSRHIHRGDGAAFATDRAAQRLTLDGIDAEMDRLLSPGQRQFFYMPLMHAEDPQLQAVSIEKFTALRDDAENVLAFARSHSAEIERFGRFPARNAALARHTSEDEQRFLRD